MTPEVLLETVTKSIRTGSAEPHFGGGGGIDNRRKNAEALGPEFVSIGEKSFFAHVVAYHKDMPDVVLKVIDAHKDGFYLYAKAVLAGEITGAMVPKIMAVTEPNAAGQSIVLMERLVHSSGDDEFNHALFSLALNNLLNGRDVPGQLEGFITFLRQAKQTHHLVVLDIHAGNWMQRADGQLVLIDPIGHYVRKGDTPC